MGVKLKSYGVAACGGTVYVFHCPGCGFDHPFHTGGDRSKHPQWNFNGSLEKPTFSPSLLVNKDYPEQRCHSFVADGKIQFLTDCWHALKGQTVEIPDWDCEFDQVRIEATKRNIGR